MEGPGDRSRTHERLETLDRIERGIREQLLEVIQQEKAEAEVKGSETEKRMGALRRRLHKAGYEYDMERLVDLRSLLMGQPPFMNCEMLMLNARQPIISETFAYLISYCTAF